MIMAAKSPTVSVKSREMIGVEQFSQRREVFDKPDAEYVPLPSPTSPVPTYREVEPIITSNHGKTTANFKRNTPGYSSMRESRTDERIFEFRPRKYSDNFTSELNQSDDVDYRQSLTERTRRLSRMRREFMTSNLYEPGSSPIQRGGTRASMPTNTSTSPVKYKIESPNLYKFPFAEPYLTPTPVRRVLLSLDSENVDGKENEDPQNEKYKSLPNHHDSTTKIDRQKLFDELVKRYSPQRKPVDWKLPPTRPKVIGSVPKSSSSTTGSVGGDKKQNDEKSEKTYDDDVFENKPNNTEANDKKNESENGPHNEILQNGPESLSNETDKKDEKEGDSKLSQSEAEEETDQVGKLATIQEKLDKEAAKKPLVEIIDLTIPDLIEKMTVEGEDLENHNKSAKKVKRKRSFLDKLLGRNKNK